MNLKLVISDEQVRVLADLVSTKIQYYVEQLIPGVQLDGFTQYVMDYFNVDTKQEQLKELETSVRSFEGEVEKLINNTMSDYRKLDSKINELERQIKNNELENSVINLEQQVKKIFSSEVSRTYEVDNKIADLRKQIREIKKAQ